MTVIADRLGQPFFRWHAVSLWAVRAIRTGAWARPSAWPAAPWRSPGCGRTSTSPTCTTTP